MVPAHTLDRMIRRCSGGVLLPACKIYALIVKNQTEETEMERNSCIRVEWGVGVGVGVGVVRWNRGNQTWLSIVKHIKHR